MASLGWNLFVFFPSKLRFDTKPKWQERGWTFKRHGWPFWQNYKKQVTPKTGRTMRAKMQSIVEWINSFLFSKDVVFAFPNVMMRTVCLLKKLDWMQWRFEYSKSQAAFTKLHLKPMIEAFCTVENTHVPPKTRQRKVSKLPTNKHCRGI